MTAGIPTLAGGRIHSLAGIAAVTTAAPGRLARFEVVNMPEVNRVRIYQSLGYATDEINVFFFGRRCIGEKPLMRDSDSVTRIADIIAAAWLMHTWACRNEKRISAKSVRCSLQLRKAYAELAILKSGLKSNPFESWVEAFSPIPATISIESTGVGQNNDLPYLLSCSRNTYFAGMMNRLVHELMTIRSHIGPKVVDFRYASESAQTNVQRIIFRWLPPPLTLVQMLDRTQHLREKLNWRTEFLDSDDEKTFTEEVTVICELLAERNAPLRNFPPSGAFVRKATAIEVLDLLIEILVACVQQIANRNSKPSNEGLTDDDEMGAVAAAVENLKRSEALAYRASIFCGS